MPLVGSAINLASQQHGSLVGNANFAPAEYGGIGCDFDGAGDYISIPSPFNPNAELTLAAWVVFDNVAGSNDVFTAERTNQIAILRCQLDKMKFWVYTGTSFELAQGATTVVTDTVYHVAGTMHSNDGMVLYLNGQQDGSNTSTAALGGGTGDWVAGIHSNLSSNPVDGREWWLTAWDRPLSAPEVAHLHDVATRWDLAYELGQVFYSLPVAAPAANPALTMAPYRAA